jgi:hypothetical protein
MRVIGGGNRLFLQKDVFSFNSLKFNATFQVVLMDEFDVLQVKSKPLVSIINRKIILIFVDRWRRLVRKNIVGRT